MSILAATTLRERATAKDTPVLTVQRGTAKAWANLNGVSSAINGSFGVSSTVDTAVGRSQVNLTVPYIAVVSHAAVSNNDVIFGGSYGVGVTAWNIWAQNGSAVNTDPGAYFAISTGDTV